MAGDLSTKAVRTAVVANGVITLAKGAGFLATASPSLLAEAIHSLADTTNQVLLMVGIHAGRRGPSRRHPWGHGQARYFWNLVSAMGIFFIGCGVTVWHGVEALLHPPAVHREGGATGIGLGVLALAFVLEGWSWYVALQALRKQAPGRSLAQALREARDPTTIGVLLEDSLAVAGVVLAFAGFMLSRATGSHVPDALASVLIGLLLGVMALWLARINGSFLIGQAVPAAEEGEISAYVAAMPEVEAVHAIRTTVLAPDQVMLDLEVELHGGLLADRQALVDDAREIQRGADPLPLLVAAAERSVRSVGRRIDGIEDRIRERFPRIVAISLEVH
ncbi:MAG: cation diffusion facilitator family transporter [Planctomycetota bacterium]